MRGEMAGIKVACASGTSTPKSTVVGLDAQGEVLGMEVVSTARGELGAQRERRLQVRRARSLDKRWRSGWHTKVFSAYLQGSNG